jgi:hypothetical protein
MRARCRDNGQMPADAADQFRRGVALGALI